MQKYNILDLHKMTIDELKKIADRFLIDTADKGKQIIIYAILDNQKKFFKQ